MSFVSKRRYYGIAILLLSLLMAALHIAAYEYALYWTVSWFDTAMHLLGGVLVGSMIGWWVAFEVPVGVRGRIPRFAVIVGGVLAAALAWEAFEWHVGLIALPAEWLDTLIDIVAGALGGYIAYGIYRKI